MKKENFIEKWANYPSIVLENEEVVKELDDALKTLFFPELQQFVVFALTRSSNERKIENALGAFKLGLEYFKARGAYHEGYPSKQCSTFFAALLVHNVYFDLSVEGANNWLGVFKLRDEMEGLAFDLYATMAYEERGMFEFVFQNVEAQLGEAMPTAGNRPVRGQNTEHFWNILWFYYHFREKGLNCKCNCSQA